MQIMSWMNNHRKSNGLKDYYEILGVQPNVDKKDIQKTFRQLAKKFHPDLNPGNKEAEEKSRNQETVKKPRKYLPRKLETTQEPQTKKPQRNPKEPLRIR